jgi:hypothetical protein
MVEMFIEVLALGLLGPWDAFLGWGHHCLIK